MADLAKFGLDRELYEREQAKRDPAMEDQVRKLILEMTGEAVDDLLVDLKDGTILCECMNTVVPGAIKITTSQMPFKQMERISLFLAACRNRLGMRENDLFTTADLYDGKSVVNLTTGMIAFSRAASKAGYRGSTIAPRESKAQPKKRWSLNPNAAVSKLMQGSSKVMEKAKVLKTGPTFGAEQTTSKWGNSEVSKMNQGSHGVMERLDVSHSNDVTFGHDSSAQNNQE